jgi:hypothetical protein
MIQFSSLGYAVNSVGNATITIDHVDGLTRGQNIYLEDKLKHWFMIWKPLHIILVRQAAFSDRFVFFALYQ